MSKTKAALAKPIGILFSQAITINLSQYKENADDLFSLGFRKIYD